MPAGQRLGDVGQRGGRPPGARQVTTTSSRAAVTTSASRRSTRSVDWSAQCRSSRSTTVSRSAAARSRSAMIRSQVRNEAPTSSVGPGAGSSMPSPARTARHGHSGGAPSSCEQRPGSTRAPLCSARTAISEAEPGLADARFAREHREGRAIHRSACCDAPTRADTSCSRPTRGQPAGGTTTAVSDGSAVSHRRLDRRRPERAPTTPGPGPVAASPSPGLGPPATGPTRAPVEHLAEVAQGGQRVGLAPAALVSATARSAQSRSRSGCWVVSCSSATAAAVCAAERELAP